MKTKAFVFVGLVLASFLVVSGMPPTNSASAAARQVKNRSQLQLGKRTMKAIRQPWISSNTFLTVIKGVRDQNPNTLSLLASYEAKQISTQTLIDELKLSRSRNRGIKIMDYEMVIDAGYCRGYADAMAFVCLADHSQEYCFDLGNEYYCSCLGIPYDPESTLCIDN